MHNSMVEVRSLVRSQIVILSRLFIRQLWKLKDYQVLDSVRSRGQLLADLDVAHHSKPPISNNSTALTGITPLRRLEFKQAGITRGVSIVPSLSQLFRRSPAGELAQPTASHLLRVPSSTCHPVLFRAVSQNLPALPWRLPASPTRRIFGYTLRRNRTCGLAAGCQSTWCRHIVDALFCSSRRFLKLLDSACSARRGLDLLTLFIGEPSSRTLLRSHPRGSGLKQTDPDLQPLEIGPKSPIGKLCADSVRSPLTSRVRPVIGNSIHIGRKSTCA